MSLSICFAAGLMSISAPLTPRARISRQALAFVVLLVAKPGSVWASTLLRGIPRRSMTRAETISACVESSPLETLGKALHLYVVRLVAVLAQHGRVRRYIRKTLDRPAQFERFVGRGELEGYAAKIKPVGRSARIVAKGVRPHPLLADAAEIDIGDRHLGIGRETLGLGEHVAQFENAGLAVPSEVGRRLAGAGGGI